MSAARGDRRLTAVALMALLAACGPGGERGDTGPGETDIDPELATAVEALEQRVRAALVGLQDAVESVDERIADADDEVVSDWEQTKVEIRGFSYEIESQLEQMRRATPDEARGLKEGLARNIEAIALRVERARLDAEDDPEEFTTLARSRFLELEGDVEALSREVREAPDGLLEDLSVEVERIQGRTAELGERLEALGDAGPDAVRDMSHDLTQALAELSARARRRLIELQHDFSDL